MHIYIEPTLAIHGRGGITQKFKSFVTGGKSLREMLVLLTAWG
jgi:hypothetical protein